MNGNRYRTEAVVMLAFGSFAMAAAMVGYLVLNFVI